MGVTADAFYFDNVISDLKDRNIEGPSAEIVNENPLVFTLIESVCQRGCSGFRQHPANLEARHLARSFCCGTLGIVEIRGTGNHRFFYFFPQLRFRIQLKFHKDLSRNFFRPVPFSGHHHLKTAVAAFFYFIGKQLSVMLNNRIGKTAADKTFYRKNCIRGVDDCLTFRGDPDELFSRLRDRDHRRGQPVPFAVLQNPWLTAFHNRDR